MSARRRGDSSPTSSPAHGIAASAAVFGRRLLAMTWLGGRLLGVQRMMCSSSRAPQTFNQRLMSWTVGFEDHCSALDTAC